MLVGGESQRPISRRAREISSDSMVASEVELRGGFSSGKGPNGC